MLSFRRCSPLCDVESSYAWYTGLGGRVEALNKRAGKLFWWITKMYDADNPTGGNASSTFGVVVQAVSVICSESEFARMEMQNRNAQLERGRQCQLGKSARRNFTRYLTISFDMGMPHPKEIQVCFSINTTAGVAHFRQFNQLVSSGDYDDHSPPFPSPETGRNGTCLYWVFLLVIRLWNWRDQRLEKEDWCCPFHIKTLHRHIASICRINKFSLVTEAWPRVIGLQEYHEPKLASTICKRLLSTFSLPRARDCLPFAGTLVAHEHKGNGLVEHANAGKASPTENLEERFSWKHTSLVPTTSPVYCSSTYVPDGGRPRRQDKNVTARSNVSYQDHPYCEQLLLEHMAVKSLEGVVPE
ncbi:uncharacterized protein CLUP02_02794 [Colletotrichum lupini]|uniref:Uncharacterized protein n=1 Tax=Colletotrichum lupini TaxID=145971 RepID=A0A9Q8SH75_9PEZI|nr:uncharacterized protein CLUP02_02794 [Colletotrichum lupini]UQC77326.1 hypothetical protein CLUP02_02794 [Colletotrichum lupini]